MLIDPVHILAFVYALYMVFTFDVNDFVPLVEIFVTHGLHLNLLNDLMIIGLKSLTDTSAFPSFIEMAIEVVKGDHH